MPKRKRDSPTRAAASSAAPAPTTSRDASPVKKKRRAVTSSDPPPDVQPVLDAIERARTALGSAVTLSRDAKSEALAKTLRAVIDPDAEDVKVRLPRPAKADPAATTALRAVLDALKASKPATAARDPRVVDGVRALVARVLDQNGAADVDMSVETNTAPAIVVEPDSKPAPSTSKASLANGALAHSSVKQTTEARHAQRSNIHGPISVGRDEDPLPETMMDDELGIPLNAVRTDDGALDDGYEWDEYTVVDLMGAFVDEAWSGSDVDSDDVAVDEAGGYGFEFEGEAWSDEDDDYYYSDE